MTRGGIIKSALSVMKWIAGVAFVLAAISVWVPSPMFIWKAMTTFASVIMALALFTTKVRNPNEDADS